MANQSIHEVCCVCLDTNTTLRRIHKWKCPHTFHEECIETWNNGCPLCRTMVLFHPNVTWNISRNPTNILNIERMKMLLPVPVEHQHVYANHWKDRGCIDSNHHMLFIQPNGVIVICEDCNTIQTYYVMHSITSIHP